MSTSGAMVRRIVGALLAGVLLALAFPPAEWSGLSFVALVPLLLAVEGCPPRRAFLLGWLMGLIHFAMVVWWVTVAMINYGYLPVPVGWALLLLLSAYLALYPGLFGAAAAWASRRIPGGAGRVIFLAAAWTALEWLRGTIFLGGFPWADIAYSQYRRLTFIQSASLAGPYGPGFLIVAVNAGLLALARSVTARGQARLREAAGAGLVILLLAANGLWGAHRLGREPALGPPLKVAAIQGNIGQSIKWDAAYREETVRIYEDLSRDAAAAGADLIIWPESAVPLYLQDEPRQQERLSGLARELGRPILFGVPAYEAEGGKLELRNRAILIDGNGVLDGFYDKMHLVPFGEYVPFKKLLFFAGKLVAEVGDFTPGRGRHLFRARGEPFGTVICYEIIFPDLVRRYVKEGAAFMTTITNDAWYERSSASLQHFTQMVFRAVENGVPVARAANTGISGFVDGRGRILALSPLFERGSYLGSIRPGRERTFYTEHGDLFAWLCLAILALWPLGTLVRRVRRPGS